MSTVAMTALLTLLLGAQEIGLVKQDGLPGRRIGGGTRHETPRVSDVSFESSLNCSPHNSVLKS